MKITTETFNVAITADFYNADGSPKYDDMGLSILDEAANITYTPFDEHLDEIEPIQVENAQGVIVLTPAVTAKSVSESGDLLVIGRFGVGYDAVDVEACTKANVAVFITRGAVDRSVAEATVAWIMALTHHVRAKDDLVRTGQWFVRSNYMGGELRNKTFGTVGLGGIAQEAIRLLNGFSMNKPLAFDPFVSADTAEAAGVELVSLDELLSRSDFVSIHCPLIDATRNLIGERELRLMKPSAYLINTARGGIVEEDALFNALMENRIAGAGIDCFKDEPVTVPHRLGKLDNVLLAPHCIAWTDELFRDIGRAICQGMVDVSHGKQPIGLLNPVVFSQGGFKQKLSRWAES